MAVVVVVVVVVAAAAAAAATVVLQLLLKRHLPDGKTVRSKEMSYSLARSPLRCRGRRIFNIFNSAVL